MIDEDSDWISLEDAVAYVEATLHCYREKALELARKAVHNLKVKSRTVHSSPKWLVSVISGQEVFHSDLGESIEVCRKDVVEFCLELRQAGTRSAPAKIGSNAAQRRPQPISDGIRLAIKDLWPGGVPTGLRAIERDNQILAWLKDKEISTTDSISRAVQRVLKAEREAHK